MKPALTPDEWGRVTAPGVRRGMSVLSVSRVVSDTGRTGIDVFTIGHDNPHIVSGFVGGTRHAIAALALHGQPFSPASREVLTLLRDRLMSDVDDGNGRKYVCVWLTAEEDALLRTHAARIEALLPPEAK